MNAFESGLQTISMPANASLAGKQYFAVSVNSSSKVILNVTGANVSLGILQTEADAADKAVAVAYAGISKAVGGAAIAAGAGVQVDAAGKLITLAAGVRVGTAITPCGANNEIFSVLLDR